MGNSLSAEAPWRGQRTTQKLSKPKTGNPTAAGLLNSNGMSNSTHPSPAARRLSLPHAPSPAASPIPPQTEPAATASASSGKKELELGVRLSRMLFRSNTSKESPHRRKRSSSVDVAIFQQGRWSNRENPMRDGSEEAHYYGQAPVQGSMSMNASRTSFNYDPSSYEAKRLLNLVEEPSHENDAVIWENQMHISEAMRADFRDRRPSVPEATPSMTRNNSEISLYTPMRRRSLMTPGIATREVRADPDPPKSRTRYSVPTTPARRESMESMGVGTISFPPPFVNSDPIPRALTPCETEYKQTGAFKHGTLRITNGSPARSPAHDLGDGNNHGKQEGLSAGAPVGDYFKTPRTTPSDIIKVESSITAIEKAEVGNTNSYLSPSQSSPPDVTVTGCSVQPQSPCLFSPEHQLIPSSPNDGKLKVPQVQATSKHTAVEDQLFDDEQIEYSSVEVLDVRVDTNAKSLPPRPKLTSERRNSREISRSDSGIASPASEYSHAPLSKADSGYSSSVSLRSFSLRPQVPEKDRDRTSDIELEVEINSSSTKQDIQAGEPEIASPTNVAPSVIIPGPFNTVSPPPVPMKDPHLIAPTSPKASGDLSPSFHQDYKLSGTSNHEQLPERVLSPSNTRSRANAIIQSRQASLRSPAASNSSVSITTGFRKPGKLQRFLSGGRAQLTVHNTHPTQYANVPAVSGDMQAKLRAHTGQVPISFRRLALKSAASKETLGTILSVGSAELLQDDDLSPNSSGSQLKTPDRKQGTPIPSIVSTIAHTTSSPFSKPPIPRKPVPVRSKDSNVKGAHTRSPMADVNDPEANKTIQASPRHSSSGAIYASPRLTTDDERARYSTPITRLAGSNTMAGHVEANGKTAYAGTTPNYELAQGRSHSTTSLELLPATSNVKISKSPPPVSMRTRNMGSLRIPPPPRSQSTPPESMQRPGRPPYSRRRSRDGNLRNHGVTSVFAPDYTAISRRLSRENFHSYPPAQAYRHTDMASAMSAMNNLRPASVGPGTAEVRGPSWDIQVDHGPSLSRRPSSDYSRRSSLASQSSQRSAATTGPGFFRQHQHQHHSQPNLPSLHRRSSYDEYNLRPEDSCVRDNGPYPSISRDGKAVVTDPWSGRSMSMPQQRDQAWDQSVQHPPHPPRQHSRHRSMDQHGNPMPYRVLHSYNSPAYRRVPIWR
ncbi:hypothetical protein F4677DRAFT_294865 [Hypoxylon crocopeplum]|nr:hypothetical protein F4677DRAFT_294865 [Hypoxylon crocopeplum]